MSISSAPAATASRVSCSLSSIEVWPDGKPVATAATATPLPSSARRASGTRSGYTQSAAQDGISGISEEGQTALAASCATFPGVSWPSSVVRSTIETASRIAASWDSALIERRPSQAARSSTPTRSTGVRRRRILLPSVPPQDARGGRLSTSSCVAGAPAAACGGGCEDGGGGRS